MKKRLLALLVGALFLLPSALATAQTVPFSVSAGPVTLTSNGALTINNLSFYASCAVSVQGTFTATITPQVTQDGTNWSTVPGASTITTPTTTNYTISSFTGFRLNVAWSSGTSVTLSATCSTASLGGGTGGGGGGGSVTQGTTPWLIAGQGTAGVPGTSVLTIQGITAGQPVPISAASALPVSPTGAPFPIVASTTIPVSGSFSAAMPLGGGATAVPTAAGQSVAIHGFNGSTLDAVRTGALNADAQTALTSGVVQTGAYLFGYNGSTWDRLIDDANKRLQTSTPPPAPTVSPYAVPAGVLVCPSTAPGVSNSTYVATCDSNGYQNVNVKGTPAPASATATALPTAVVAVKASAGTLVTAQFTNSDTSTVYCSIFNVAAASVTLGTTAPLITVAVPAGLTQPVYTPPTLGAAFGTAISAACATTFGGSSFETAGKVAFSAFYY